MSNSADMDLPSASQTSDMLAEVALNLRWSWNHSADQLWERLNPELWDLTHNPWFVLQTVSQGGYTPQVVPYRVGASVPLEAPFIGWRDI